MNQSIALFGTLGLLACALTASASNCQLSGFDAHYNLVKSGKVVGSNQRNLQLQANNRFTLDNHLKLHVLWIKMDVASHTEGSYSAQGFQPHSMLLTDAQKHTRKHITYTDQQNSMTYILQLRHDLLAAAASGQAATHFSYPTNLAGKNVTMQLSCKAGGSITTPLGNFQTTFCQTQSMQGTHTGLWFAPSKNMLLVQSAQYKGNSINVSNVIKSVTPDNSAYCVMPASIKQ